MPNPTSKSKNRNLKSKAAQKSRKSVTFKTTRPKTPKQKKSTKVVKRYSF